MPWRDVLLGDVVTFQRGYDITKAQQRDGPYPVISSSGPNSTHDEFIADGPGVVIGRKGSLGGVFYSDGPYWPHDTTLWVRDFHGNNPKFIYYFLQSLPLAHYDVGSSNPTLNRNHLHLLPVRVPDQGSQHQVASILSAYDDLIENNTRRIQILEEMAQAIYREWFVEFRFPGHEGVRMVASELGRIPEGWTVVPASTALEIDPRLKPDPTLLRPFVPMTSLSERIMHIESMEQREGSAGSKFQNGDILFARITPCLENGKTAFVQGLGPSEIGSGSTEFIVLRSRLVTPQFAYLLARSDPFRANAIKSMSGATGRQRVRASCFDSYLLAVPPDSILSRFCELTSPLFTLSYSLFRATQILRQTRDLLLPRLTSGEIDVSDLDIGNAEPAA